MKPTPGDSYIRTSYMNRVLWLPPHVAQAAYDARHHDSADWCLLAPAKRARLDVTGPAAVTTGGSCQPYRRQAARIRTGTYRWPVELELLPWSNERTELGLRPVTVALCWALPPPQVLDAGHALLDELERQMRAWAEQPLRALADLAADQPHRAATALEDRASRSVRGQG